MLQMISFQHEIIFKISQIHLGEKTNNSEKIGNLKIVITQFVMFFL